MNKLNEAISNAVKLHFKNDSNPIKLQIDICNVDIKELPEATELHSGEDIIIRPQIFIVGMLKGPDFIRHIKYPQFNIFNMKIRFNQKEKLYEVIELGTILHRIFEY